MSHSEDESPSTLQFGMALPRSTISTKRPAVAVASVRLQLGVFCRALGQALHATIQPVVCEDYDALLDAVRTDNLDLIWLPPLIAAQAEKEGIAHASMLPVRRDHTWYATALFAAPNSTICSLDDLQNSTVGWVDPKSMGGYVVIRGWLRSQGLDVGKVFARETFYGSHEAVVEAVLSGEVDVGATFAHFAKGTQDLESACWGDEPVTVIATTGVIPPDVIAVRTGTPTPIQEALCNALLDGDNEELRGSCLALFEADRFQPVETEQMNELLKLLPHLDESRQ